MSLVLFSSFLALFSVVSSRPQLGFLPIVAPDAAPEITNTICGDIVVQKAQGYSLFWASDVFECLQNVPFTASVATRFLNYYNQTLQFQSTLAYLKDPPQAYQQPPVDVLNELQLLQDKVDSGFYNSQYVFESELQLLINRIHDAHVYLSAGALAPFSFVSPYGLVSASPDGKEVPSIYIQSDVVTSRDQGWVPSPITKINNVDVVEYLTAFAEINSEGYIEPHADWNALMESPVRDIQGGLSVLQSATFYPGDELNFSFANDTVLETFWLATFSEEQETGPLTTSGDYYNYFVLGLLPDSFKAGEQWWPNEVEVVEGDDVSEDNNEVEEPEPDYKCNAGKPNEHNWCFESSGAFPNDPATAQEHLGVTEGGVVTGYFLKDISTGVLSIPSFYQSGNDTDNFISAVNNFIEQALKTETKKIVIDLQQNDGGLQLIALFLFKRFFYGIEPFTGSRIRAHDAANVLGTSYNKYWTSLEKNNTDNAFDLYWYFASSEWIATNRINPATGKTFSSWAEYMPSNPVPGHGDLFSLPQAYNLSDEIFDTSAFGGYIPFGYGESEAPDTPAQLWAPEDIVILTDGLCSSACAYFVELMTQQAGVKTVVVGGRPTTGPMQTAGGNRGARLYSAEALDFDISNVEEVIKDKEALAQLPVRDPGMWINFAGINIRDQIREGESSDASIPLQFRYEAAECRIYYTLENVYNMTKLWHDAATATWFDPSLCVAGSTGFAPSRNSTKTPKTPPLRTAQSPNLNITSLTQNTPPDLNINATLSLLDVQSRQPITVKDLVICNDDGSCLSGTCIKVLVTCSDKKTKKYLPVCVPRCSTTNPACTGELTCRVTKKTAESKKQLPPRKKKTDGGNTLQKFEKLNVYTGVCEPLNVDTTKYTNLGCPAH